MLNREEAEKMKTMVIKSIDSNLWIFSQIEQIINQFTEPEPDRPVEIPVMKEESFAMNNQCEFCDTFGGEKTYNNQVCMPLNGKVVCIDYCIHHIVAALNAGGIKTVACCCGHNELDGRIDLEDGRILIIKNRVIEAEKVVT